MQALLPLQAKGVQSVTCEVHCPPAPQVSTVSIDDVQVVVPQTVPAG